MANANDLTVQELAAFCTSTNGPELKLWRDKAAQYCAERVAAGTFLPGLAWRTWSWTVDVCSMWLHDRPDAPIRRDGGEHPRYAHCRATRKGAARMLATRWQRENAK